MNFHCESPVFLFVLILTNFSSFILSEELKSDISCSRIEDFYKLEARGEVLKFSEILNITCHREIKIIEIFAFEKIIIDKDLIKVGEEIQVNIISPVWEIVGERIINLDGSDAVNSWKPEQRECDNIQKSAIDGVPGRPGGPGGTFYGIMSKSINGQNLIISTNGGKGSNGQNGCKIVATEAKIFSNGIGGEKGSGGFHGLVELFSLKNHTIDIVINAKNGTDGNFGKIGDTEGYEYPRKAIILEDFRIVVKKCRKFVEHMIFNTSSDKYLSLYFQLQNSQFVKKSILYYIEELTNLENHYTLLSNRSVYLSMLKEWERDFCTYSLNESEKRDDYSKVISRLKNIVSGKIRRLEDKFYDGPVLRFREYLESCTEYFRSGIRFSIGRRDSKIPEIREALSELIRIHYANDLIDEYKNLEIAFLQVSFPFIDRFPLVTNSRLENIVDPLRKSYLEFEILSHIQASMSFLESASITNFGQKSFYPPFFVWNSSFYSSEIKNILEGREVKLFANISSQREFNAMKLRLVKIVISSDDREVNEQLQNDLKNFEVTLIHSGDSYYRCDEKVYLFKTGAHYFRDWMYLRKKKFDYNSSTFNFVLSPYATWSIQLKIRDKGQKMSFHSLDKYVNKVQIELVGRALFMDANLDVCKNEFPAIYGKEMSSIF